MYNVFCDFHHAGLLNSLIMLFEGRLGGKVYRPIGMEWAEKGYWRIYDHPATQLQYLGIGGATPDGSPRLNEVVETGNTDQPIAGVYHCKDIEGDRTNKAITFDAFMAIPFDILIASIPAHIEPFKRLCREHPSKPKLIYQIGNSWTVEAGLAPNIMASAMIPDVPPNVHFISYHQEFDVAVFRPGLDDPVPPGKNIYSFVNCFNTAEHLKTDWRTFIQIEEKMPGWAFKALGGQCRDGCCNGTQELAQKMREARFIWHTKNGGDGYGHVLHNSAAVARPLVTRKIYYSGKLGEQLMIDGKTCINIDNLTLEEMVQKIEFYSEPARYAEMCKQVYQNFQQVCNFDAEFLLLRDWLSTLI